MKNLPLFFFLLIPFFVFSKEQPLPTKIKKVTVFMEGAQVLREASIHLPKGKTELIISDLSKFLDPKSIRVKGIGDFTVLTIQNHLDYLKEEHSEVDDHLRKQIKAIDQEIKLLAIERQALAEKQSFLKDNRKVAGTNNPISFADYDQYFKLYTEQMHQILLKQNEIDIKSNQLRVQRNDLVNQLNETADKERKGFYKIHIIVQADRAMPAKFEISYYVGNCGWFPTYDIRIENLSKPVALSYKANLRQSTGVDWKNVLLTFSNAAPTDAGDVPVLSPFYLGEYSPRTRRSNKPMRITGVITDERGEPLYGASVIVSGTTIGTTTNLDGKYDITVPPGEQYLEVSYLGYESQSKPVASTRIDFALQEGINISEVVVTSMGISEEDAGVEPSVGLFKKKERKRKKSVIQSKPIKMDMTTNTTSLEFDIKVPYTILSKPKSQVIEMRHFEMPATYEYQIVPKLELAAYLMAYITDWEQFQLLDGESNLYFENTYVGKALISATSVNDTLKLSLGKDKSIAVTRTNIKDKSNKRLIGTKKIIKKAWRTEIKNNKSIPVHVLVFDQVPVSRKDKVEVTDIKYGSADYNETTGEIKWQAEIAPFTKKSFNLRYTVKHPKNWSIVVE